MEERGSTQFKLVINRVEEMKALVGVIMATYFCSFLAPVSEELKQLVKIAEGTFLEFLMKKHHPYDMDAMMMIRNETRRAKIKEWTNTVCRELTIFNQLKEINRFLSEIYVCRKAGNERVFCEIYDTLLTLSERCEDRVVRNSPLFNKLAEVGYAARVGKATRKIIDLENELMEICRTVEFSRYENL